MKVFKIISNILQLAGAGYYLYYFVSLVLMLAAWSGESILTVIFSGLVWAYLLIGIVLALNAIIGIFVKKTYKVRTLSIINLALMLAYSVLIGFNFELYFGIGFGVIALCNLLDCIFYKYKRKTVY